MGRRLVERKFPLISSWTRNKIHKRCDLERKKARIFGHGKVEKTLTIKEEKETENDDKKEHLKEVVGAAMEFAGAFSKFVDVVERANSKFPNFQAVAKLHNLANMMVDVYQECDTPDKAEEHTNNPKEHTNNPKEHKAKEKHTDKPKEHKLEDHLRSNRRTSSYN